MIVFKGTIKNVYVNVVVSLIVFARFLNFISDVFTYMTVVRGRLYGTSTENIITFLLVLYSFFAYRLTIWKSMRKNEWWAKKKSSTYM